MVYDVFREFSGGVDDVLEDYLERYREMVADTGERDKERGRLSELVRRQEERQDEILDMKMAGDITLDGHQIRLDIQILPDDVMRHEFERVQGRTGHTSKECVSSTNSHPAKAQPHRKGTQDRPYISLLAEHLVRVEQVLSTGPELCANWFAEQHIHRVSNLDGCVFVSR